MAVASFTADVHDDALRPACWPRYCTVVLVAAANTLEGPWRGHAATEVGGWLRAVEERVAGEFGEGPRLIGLPAGFLAVPDLTQIAAVALAGSLHRAGVTAGVITAVDDEFGAFGLGVEGAASHLAP